MNTRDCGRYRNENKKKESSISAHLTLFAAKHCYNVCERMMMYCIHVQYTRWCHSSGELSWWSNEHDWLYETSMVVGHVFSSGPIVCDLYADQEHIVFITLLSWAVLFGTSYCELPEARVECPHGAGSLHRIDTSLSRLQWGRPYAFI